jgi:hypothetical protein
MKSIYKLKEGGFFTEATEEFKHELAQNMRKKFQNWHENFFWKNMFANKYRTGLNEKEEINPAYTEWIERETWRSMEVEQASRLAINSLGIGPIISSIVFTMMQGLGIGVPKMPEELTSAVTVMFNSPTEMISFTAAILAANNIGWERCPWLTSNDEQKNIQIMAKIFEKSRDQYEKNNKELVEITDKELHTIYNPYLTTMRAGKLLTKFGIFLWKKWDRFKERKEYKQNKLAGLTGANEQSLFN